MRDAYSLTMDAFSLWQASGKPRDDYIAHTMMHSQAILK